MKKRELQGLKLARAFKPAEQLNRQIPPEPHTAMYVWHKYWSRKTWNVVGEFIKTYTREDEIVFDPFSGSGVVAIEAARNKRRAIVCDLNPVATVITELTLRPVKLKSLYEAFERVRDAVKKDIEKLYEAHCVKCDKPVVAACFVREGDTVVEVRYPGCPNCGHRCETGCKPSKADVETLETLERKKIKQWYPTQKLYYPDGQPFKEKQRYDSLDQLFTKRNLLAAAILMEAIEKEKSPQLKKFLKGAFSSMIHLCTRMMPVGNPAPSNHYTFFSSPGWTQHSYWSAPRFMEQNVWEKFEGAVIGHQGIIKAKTETNEQLPDIRITDDYRRVLKGEADIAVVTADCVQLMNKMPRESVHYVFTDPPYDASIQYGELSYLWNAWLKETHKYTETLCTFEIVRNERQRKSFDAYRSFLNGAFREIFQVLESDRYLTITFHNPTFQVRNATVRCGYNAGFDYQKIHHQPLGQVSAKAMMQPFGSAQGDFYLRFQKPGKVAAREMHEISDERFRRIVIDKCKKVIAERAEPTPYTILINFVDPELAKQGFFGTLETGLDVKEVLEESIGKEFKLVKAKMGGAEGELWWFNDPIFVARLAETPLSERVEETVFRILNRTGSVSFTQVWNEISQQFPNSLTSDSTSIREALEIYGRPGSKGMWVIRDEIRQHVTQHSEIIALLALMGKREGYEICVGRNEQGHRAGGLAPDNPLSHFMTVNPQKLQSVSNLRVVLNMDLLWIKDDEVVTAFEVESTTTMTSGLLRGSNLPANTPKVMVIPDAREDDFRRKMESPLFSEHFEKESWQLLYFETLRSEFSKKKASANLADLLGVKPTRKARAAEKNIKQDEMAL